MARQTINLGTGINTGTGDTLRVAMDKVNDNTEELYNAVFGTDSANTSINVSQISTEVTNGSITLTPNGTGQVVVEADLIVDNLGDINKRSTTLYGQNTETMVNYKCLAKQIGNTDENL